MLRKIGMWFLYLFFYASAIGNASILGKYYLAFIYGAIGIAMIILFLDPSCLDFYREYFVWQICFITLQALSVLYTINVSDGFSIFSSMVKILSKITAIAIICKNFEGIKQLLKGFALLGGACFLKLLFTGHLFEEWRLGTDLLGNSNSFAMIVTVFVVGAIYWSFNYHQKLGRLFYILMACVDMLMILLSGGRKFIIFSITLVFFMFIYSNNGVKVRRVIVAVFCIIVLLIVGFNLIMKVEVLYRTIGIRLTGIGTSEGAMGVKEQQDIMKRGIEMFIQKPFLGWGVGGFQQYYFYNYGTYFYAHSNYVELLADFGIVGFIVYYFQYLYCLAVMLKNRRIGYEEQKLYIPLLISIFAIDVFSVSFNQTIFIPMFIMWTSGFVQESSHTA